MSSIETEGPPSLWEGFLGQAPGSSLRACSKNCHRGAHRTCPMTGELLCAGWGAASPLKEGPAMGGGWRRLPTSWGWGDTDLDPEAYTLGFSAVTRASPLFLQGPSLASPGHMLGLSPDLGEMGGDPSPEYPPLTEGPVAFKGGPCRGRHSPGGPGTDH